MARSGTFLRGNMVQSKKTKRIFDICTHYVSIILFVWLDIFRFSIVRFDIFVFAFAAEQFYTE